MSTKRYSPELVSAQWSKDGIKGVSYETIYKFICDCKHSQKRINTLSMSGVDENEKTIKIPVALSPTGYRL